jgi:hypothetical protein
MALFVGAHEDSAEKTLNQAAFKASALYAEYLPIYVKAVCPSSWAISHQRQHSTGSYWSVAARREGQQPTQSGQIRKTDRGGHAIRRETLLFPQQFKSTIKVEKLDLLENKVQALG